MQATIRSVNATGLAEIAEFLAANHKLGAQHFTPDMLRAWAAQAEFSISEGNGPDIEIVGYDAVRGATITYTISDEGLDTETVEVDD